MSAFLWGTVPLADSTAPVNSASRRSVSVWSFAVPNRPRIPLVYFTLVSFSGGSFFADVRTSGRPRPVPGAATGKTVGTAASALALSR